MSGSIARRIRTWAAALVAVTGTATVQANADTFYVNGTCGDDGWTGTSSVCTAPNGPKLTIQAGIDAAREGDVVLVVDGIYTGEGNRDLTYGGKLITVRSENGPETCSIDVAATSAEPHRAFIFNQGEDQRAVVEGFTIERAIANENTAGFLTHGGAVLCDGSSPTFRDCIFDTNRAGSVSSNDAGGAIFCRNSSMIVEDCVFRQNRAESAGGAIWTFDSNASLRRCSFVNNSAGFGGAVYCSGGATELRDCEIRENTAESRGGGVFLLGGAPSLIRCMIEGNTSIFGAGILVNSGDPLISDCHLLRNEASGSGGAIYSQSAAARMLGCVFEENHARYGGAISTVNNGTTTVVGCTFLRNTAVVSGGGLEGFGGGTTIEASNCEFFENTALIDGGAVASEGEVILSHCTLSQNVASGFGGGLALLANGSATVRNCIFWRDEPNEIEVRLGDADVTYSDIRRGWPGVGNIASPPLFRDRANGDLHLKPDSPCIDAGDPAFVPTPAEADIDGQVRVWNGRVDMGADEFGSFVLGDVNCDNDINAFDIEPFLLALFDPTGYTGAFPDCDIIVADINADGSIDAFDIEPFLDLLFP